MIKEELDKITLDSVRVALEEVGFDVRIMENCIVVDEGFELYAYTRGLHHDHSAEVTLELFKESMRHGYWDRGVGRIYLYQVGHHVISDNDYVPTVRYALHLGLGTREGFEPK
ncbi:MAG: hypothetical protein ACTSYO_02340 [Candidatus Ranarchaeia archaeon]